MVHIAIVVMLILNLNKFRQDNVIQKFLDFIVAHKGFIVFNEQVF